MSWSAEDGSLDLATLRRLYRAGALKPRDLVEAVHARIERRGGSADPVWITLFPQDWALARAADLEGLGDPDSLPLYGVPIGIKDNFDLAGFPTTMGCQAWSRTPPRTDPLVERLLALGAIPIGKQNMDQFGMGLVGVRSDFGIPRCAFDDRYISGGSTSGSGVAVATGLVSLALGGDAAGSGRVPAALNNIVGLKPTPGLVPQVPAAPGGAGSIGTHSFLALTVEDAVTATRAVIGYDARDPVSRPEADGFALVLRPLPTDFRFGVPDARGRTFHGDADAAALFEQAIERLAAMGGTPLAIDMTPFNEVAAMLYGGPWIAQRHANWGAFFAAHPDAVHPATRAILAEAERYSAADAFRAIYRLGALRQEIRAIFAAIDVLVTPTTPTTFTVAEVEAEPIALNSVLGTYTNFANLLELCVCAVPNGFLPSGLPQGISFIGPPLEDARVASFAAAYHRRLGGRVGATATERAMI
jgi:allophanate hydrolase